MPPTAPLDVFFDEVLRTNPFETNRVVPAQSAWVDAEDIFADVFRQLLERVELAHRERLAQGILLWGEAGIGKSHLLARLERRLCADPPQALFVALANLQAEPERMPRALLRSVMGVLTAGRAERWRGTPLWRAVNGMLRTALGGDTGRVYGIPEAEQAYQRLVDTLCRETPGRAAVLDRTVFDVLLRFIIGALDRTGRQNDSADLAVRWLRGDWLDAEDAERLGVPMTADGGGIADDEQVKKTLVALAQVALLWGRPMVLVLDQVDNLEPAQFKALTRFLHALLDAASNLVVITAGVQATLVQWRQEKVVQDSSWDRLAQFTVELQRLPLAAAAPLVTVRLDDFCKPFAGMEEVTGRRRRDPFFPLGAAWFEQVGRGRSDLRPRDMLNHARRGWQELRTALRARQGAIRPEDLFPALGARAKVDEPAPADEGEIQRAIEQTVRRRLDELRQREKTALQTRGWDPEGLADVLKTLTECWLRRAEHWPFLKNVERVAAQGQQRPTLHLLLEQRLSPTGPDLRRGVACLLAPEGKTLTAQLERLLKLEEPPDQLVLVHEERTPLKPGAQGRTNLAGLRDVYGENLHVIALSHDEQSLLFALKGVLGQANSPEFEVDLADGQSRRIGRAEALDALLRDDALVGARLLRLLVKTEVAEGTLLAAASE